MSVLAKIEAPGSGEAIGPAPGADCYRLSGLEVTRKARTGVNVGSKSAQRWSIHDVVIDDISAAKYAGNGNLYQISR